MSDHSQAEKLIQAHCGCAPGRRRANGSSHSNECNNQTSQVAIALSQARAEGRREGLEEAAKAAEEVGNFGDYRRDELTKDYGQPKFDMMHDIIAAIRALAQKEGKDGPHR